MIAAMSQPPLYFDAMLTPHRSLSPTGFRLLMTCVCTVSFTAGMAFLLMGAWPVFGFFGLDVLLVYLAFHQSYRSALLTETVQLGKAELVVRRVTPDGKARLWRFQPYWLRLHMDDPPRHDSQLTLSSHGHHLIIGAFLAPEERGALARALRAALQRRRTA